MSAPINLKVQAHSGLTSAAEDANTAGRESPAGHIFIDVAAHIYIAALLTAPLEAFIGSPWNEPIRAVMTFLMAVLITYVGSRLFKAWATQVLSVAWSRQPSQPWAVRLERAASDL